MEFSITRGLLSSCAGVEKEHKASSFNTRFRDGEFHGVSSPFRTYTYGVRESTGSMRAFQASHGPTGMRHTALKNGFQQSHITRNHAPHGLKGRFPAKPCHTVARNYVPHGQMEVFQQSHVRGQPCATRPNGGFPAEPCQRATMRHTAKWRVSSKACQGNHAPHSPKGWPPANPRHTTPPGARTAS